MPNLPRLNQIATFFETSRTTDFGAKVLVGLGVQKRCRYAVMTKTYRDSKGDDITYNAEIHLNYDSSVKKGTYFKLDNNLYYEVLECTHTPSLNGQYFKTYCKLKETYVKIDNVLLNSSNETILAVDNTPIFTN